MNPLASDLDELLERTTGLWRRLRGRRIFITGGTGFVGCWLLESLLWANRELELDVRCAALTRAPEEFRRKAPHLAGDGAVELFQGDVRDFDFPPGKFDLVVHAATPASSALNQEDPLQMFDIIVRGTRRTLDFAVARGARGFLFTSSGAVYGRQPTGLTHTPEEHTGGPDPANPASAYAEGKRAAELLCAVFARQHGIEPKIARCFAFVGPYLPLDVHFAVGNFMRDAIAGGPILVNGDGSPWRSYLYAAELAEWLWTVLLDGRPCRPYNVGSSEAVTIVQLARLVAQAAGGAPEIRIARLPVPGQPAERYIPLVDRAGTELGLRPRVPLLVALERSICYLRGRHGWGRTEKVSE